jgi:hypothetical protein
MKQVCRAALENWSPKDSFQAVGLRGEMLIKPCYLLLKINQSVSMIGHLFDLVRDMFS